MPASRARGRAGCGEGLPIFTLGQGQASTSAYAQLACSLRSLGCGGSPSVLDGDDAEGGAARIRGAAAERPAQGKHASGAACQRCRGKPTLGWLQPPSGPGPETGPSVLPPNLCFAGRCAGLRLTGFGRCCRSFWRTCPPWTPSSPTGEGNESVVGGLGVSRAGPPRGLWRAGDRFAVTLARTALMTHRNSKDARSACRLACRGSLTSSRSSRSCRRRRGRSSRRTLSPEGPPKGPGDPGSLGVGSANSLLGLSHSDPSQL